MPRAASSRAPTSSARYAIRPLMSLSAGLLLPGASRRAFVRGSGGRPRRRRHPIARHQAWGGRGSGGRRSRRRRRAGVAAELRDRPHERVAAVKALPPTRRPSTCTAPPRARGGGRRNASGPARPATPFPPPAVACPGRPTLHAPDGDPAFRQLRPEQLEQRRPAVIAFDHDRRLVALGDGERPVEEAADRSGVSLGAEHVQLVVDVRGDDRRAPALTRLPSSAGSSPITVRR
jgi:hypothetical protein